MEIQGRIERRRGVQIKSKKCVCVGIGWQWRKRHALPVDADKKLNDYFKNNGKPVSVC